MVLRITLEKKNLKTRSVAIFLVLIAVISLGCTEQLEEPIDKTSIYVYEEEMGQEGDPQEEISEFYDIVSSQTEGEQSGPPEFVPLKKYAVEFDIDPDTGVIKIDTMKIYDSYGNLVDQEAALAIQKDIVKDDSGKIITDAAKLDLHIQPIGTDKYQILNLAQQMQDDDGKFWTVKKLEGKYMDKDLTDDVINVNDGWDEFSPGFVRGEDGIPYGVIIIDQDVFDLYEKFGIKAKEVNDIKIVKGDCLDLGGGLYVSVYELPEKSATVHSPVPISRILPENHDNFAMFRFVKE